MTEEGIKGDSRATEEMLECFEHKTGKAGMLTAGLRRVLQPPRTVSPSCNPNLSAKPSLFKPFLLEKSKRSAINVQVLRWEVSVEVFLLGF